MNVFLRHACGAALALMAGLAVGAPLRVAVAPAPKTLVTGAQLADSNRFSIVVSLFLRDQLGRMSEVRVLDEVWCRALFDEYGGRKWADPGATFYPSFIAQVPVDGILDFRFENGAFLCRLRDGKQNPEFRFPCPAGAPVLSALPGLAAFLVRELKLDPATAGLWQGAAGTNSAEFESVYLSRRLETEWIYNRGEARVGLLLPHLGALSGNRALASAVLDAALQLTLDTRAPKAPESGITAARMALLQLLDTPAEPEVRAFLTGNKFSKESLEKELLELAEPLFSDALEDIVAAAEGKREPLEPEGTLTGLAANLAEKPTRGKRLGALRCLGVLKSARADGVLTRAASGEADVREAARFASAHRTPEADRPALVPIPDSAPVAAWLDALSDPRSGVAEAALNGRPPAQDARIAARLEAWANGPYAPVAEAARLALVPQRPSEAAAAARFDLRVEHPWVRLQTLEGLATNRAEWALPVLADAATNRDAHVRGRALSLLAGRDPAAGSAAAQAALSDPHRWVRWQAAAVLATTASAAQAAALKAALAGERDAALRLYLADAVARAEGRPLPAPPPAVHTFDPARNRTLGCGYGLFVESSPLQGYYCLDTRITEAARRAHAKGKLFLCRANATSRNAGLIAVDAFERDRFWLGLETELEGLDAIDGLVIGEESMGCPARSLWAAGWRLFCRDARLDPARIRGDYSTLSAREAAAYRNWERTMEVEGFNILYDFIKLRYGKVRPGFQVATFLPNEEGPNPADRRWKFDIAGGYNYDASNRDMAAEVRRYKTLWPGRPVVWLSLANGLVGLGGPSYKSRYPTNTVTSRAMRVYADAVSVWLAGAETGWFNSWLFVGKDAKGGLETSGCWLVAEDYAARSDAQLRKAIDFSFAGVAEMRQEEARQGKAPAATAVSMDKPAAMELELADPQVALEALEKTVNAEKERMRLGYHLERKFYFDCARALAGLPRPAAAVDVLLVGPRAGAAGFELFPGFDYLNPVAALAGQDLTRYRFIGMAGSGQALLTDAVMAGVTEWLKREPGLLYVRGGLSADNGALEPLAGNLDGRLQGDWPWEPEVAFGTGGVMTVTGRAEVLSGTPERPGLVLWTHADYKGAVLFDGGVVKADELGGIVNRLNTERGLGKRVEGLPSCQTGSVLGIRACVTAGGMTATQVVAGVDFLTGERAPEVGAGRGAALTAAGYSGIYVISTNRVTVLSEEPVESADAVPGGVRVKSAGVIRAGSETGRVKVVSPLSLPVIEDGEEAVRWVAWGETPGVAEMAAGPAGGRVVFVRCADPVTFIAVD